MINSILCNNYQIIVYYINYHTENKAYIPYQEYLETPLSLVMKITVWKKTLIFCTTCSPEEKQPTDHSQNHFNINSKSLEIMTNSHKSGSR